MRALLISLAALAAAGCNGVVVGGDKLSDGQPLNELELEEFDSVSLRGPDHVEVTLGDAFDIRVEGDDDVVELIEFEIKRNALHIGRRNNNGITIGGESATIFITLPVLNGASIAGSGDMRVDRAESDNFAVSIAGSGSLSLGALEAQQAEFNIAGSGDIAAAGTVADLAIGIAGSGDIEAEELRVERADIDIAGSGNVEIFATDTVNGSMIGSGDIRVRGGARCDSSSIGSGDMRCD